MLPLGAGGLTGSPYCIQCSVVARAGGRSRSNGRLIAPPRGIRPRARCFRRFAAALFRLARWQRPVELCPLRPATVNIGKHGLKDDQALVRACEEALVGPVAHAAFDHAAAIRARRRPRRAAEQKAGRKSAGRNAGLTDMRAPSRHPRGRSKARLSAGLPVTSIGTVWTEARPLYRRRASVVVLRSAGIAVSKRYRQAA